MLLQKIEFWLFSVPALVVAIGGIAHYGTWRVLWVFPISFVLTPRSVSERSCPLNCWMGRGFGLAVLGSGRGPTR